jgi:hypothetical protein
MSYPMLAWRGDIFLNVYCETPIPKAKRSGIGELNNPAACFGV